MEAVEYIKQNFELVDNPPKGSAFITPEGKFVDLLSKGFDHLSLLKKLEEVGVPIGGGLDSEQIPGLQDNGWIRCNEGVENNYAYIEFTTVEPTIPQVRAATKWIDFVLSERSELSVIYMTEDLFEDETYSNLVSGKNIMNSVYKAYRTGELIPNAALEAMPDQPKLTPEEILAKRKAVYAKARKSESATESVSKEDLSKIKAFRQEDGEFSFYRSDVDGEAMDETEKEPFEVIGKKPVVKVFGHSCVIESNLSRVNHHLKNGAVAISVSRDVYSPEENRMRTKELRDRLRSSGYGYLVLVGGYHEEAGDVVETSFLVPCIKNRESFPRFVKRMSEFGKQYEQESILVIQPSEVYYMDPRTGKKTNSFSGVKFDKSDSTYFSMLAKGNHRNRKWNFEGVAIPDTLYGKHRASLENMLHYI